MTCTNFGSTSIEFRCGPLQTTAPAAGWFPHDLAIHPIPNCDELEQGMLVESGVHGTCYSLARTDTTTARSLLAHEAASPESPRTRTFSLNERRSNIGSFQRVLVADEHPGTRRMVIQMLRRWGFEAMPAVNASEVLNFVLQKQAPELLIMSTRLPGIEFFELCRRLSNRMGDYAPYILAMGMQNDKQQVIRALESGAAEYLTTPFEAEELKARLLVATRILRRQENLISSRDRFRLLATKDSLTGIWNRRSIDPILSDELNRASHADRSTGALLIDLDHFKKINDTYGHLAGDFVLQEVSRRLKTTIRAYDSIGRYGGEEFLVVVPGSGEIELCELAERLRTVVEKDPIWVGGHQIRLTLSVGAVLAPPRAGNTVQSVLANADSALYKAKKFGRNRYVFADARKVTVPQSDMSSDSSASRPA